MHSFSSPIQRSKSEIIRLSEVALDIQKSFKALNYYKEGHPALTQTLSVCHNGLTEKLEGLHDLAISVKRRGFFSGFHQVGKGIHPLASLAGDFYVRGVRKIFILKGLTLNDFTVFMATIHLSPKLIQEEGGLEYLLAEKGVTTVWVNEINYDRLLSKDLSRKVASGELETNNVENGKLPDTINSPNDSKEELGRSLPKIEKKINIDTLNLAELLAEIKTSVDDSRYRDIIAIMIPLVEKEVLEKRFDLSLEVLFTLSGHVDNLSYISREREVAALGGVIEMAYGPLVEFLIMSLSQSGNVEKASSVLLKMGEKVFDELLDALEEAGDLRFRKAIIRIVESFGSRVIKKVIRRLYDSRWFVARNMVTILGELGGNESIDALVDMFVHSEIRVRKEAVKSLSKCGGRESAMLLIEKFDNADKELQRLIIFSLGIMDESVAFPTLLKVIRKKSFFKAEPELRKEAIHAIGKLQIKTGISALEEILISNNLFNKEKEDIRVASAQSLAYFTDERSIHALRKGSMSKNIAVRETCDRLLVGLTLPQTGRKWMN